VKVGDLVRFAEFRDNKYMVVEYTSGIVLSVNREKVHAKVKWFHNKKVDVCFWPLNCLKVYSENR